MFFTRTIGKAFRGKASPLQIRLAALLAGMLGFVPGFFLAEDLGGGFLQAPGLILALLFLVLVLNANLAVFGIVLLLAKLLSVLLLPMSFAVGRVLLDGPTQGLFQSMINAPVLAWFGLEHYATSGGLLVGTGFGLLTGWLFVRSVRRLRSEMADLEEGSERYQQLSGRRSVRFLGWVFLGKGKGKKTSWRELSERDRQGLPVRLVGIAVVLVLGLCLWAGHTFLAGPALGSATRTALEHYNGATVDLDETILDLSESQLRIAGLGMADPNALTKNLFQARSLEFKLGTGDLLSKRFVIDRVESREAATGAERSTPGARTAEAEPAPTPPPPPGTEEVSKTLEDYLQEAEKWKQRLEQVSHWLERLSGSDEAVQEETPEQHDERVEQSARDYGMAMVRAAHLVNESPMVLVRELVFEGVEAIDLDGEILDLRGRNLSSNPRLVTEPLEFSLPGAERALRLHPALRRGGRRTGTDQLPLPRPAGGLDHRRVAAGATAGGNHGPEPGGRAGSEPPRRPLDRSAPAGAPPRQHAGDGRPGGDPGRRPAAAARAARTALCSPHLPGRPDPRRRADPGRQGRAGRTAPGPCTGIAR